jgi:hydroxyacyl-ACP dehydratase HTD2-like protein with hotdog domain
VREYLAGTGGDLAGWVNELGNAAPVKAPRLFFHAACRPVVAEQDLLPDGQYPGLSVDGITGRSMAGSHRYEIHQAVFVGDVLTVTITLTDITEKLGRSGPLVFATTESEYTNQRGELVARYEQTIIYR